MQGQACMCCCAMWVTLLSCAGHGHRVTGLCLLPPGNVLASVSHDRCLRLWDLQTFRLIKTVKDAHETPLQVRSASSCNSSGLRGAWLAVCWQQPGHCHHIRLQATQPTAWCITCTPPKHAPLLAAQASCSLGTLSGPPVGGQCLLQPSSTYLALL